jgi:hypothetical protein
LKKNIALIVTPYLQQKPPCNYLAPSTYAR